MCGYTCLCIFWYTFLCTLLQISFLFIALFSMSFVGKFTPMIDGLFHSLRAYASSYHPAPLRISVSVFGCLPCVWLLDFPALLLSVQTQNTFIFLRSSTQPWNDFFSHFDSARPVFFFSHHCHRYFLLIKALTYISFFFSHSRPERTMFVINGYSFFAWFHWISPPSGEDNANLEINKWKKEELWLLFRLAQSRSDKFKLLVAELLLKMHFVYFVFELYYN